MQKRRRVLIGFDRHGWAFHRIAKQIKERLRDEYIVKTVPMYASDIHRKDGYRKYDALIAVYWGVTHWEPMWRAKRYLMVYDHFMWRAQSELFQQRVGEATEVFASSELLVDEIYALTGRKPVLCTDGVDSQLFTPVPVTRSHEDEFAVGWAGNAALGNGLKRYDVVQAACELAGVTLRVAGPRSLTYRPFAEMPGWYRDEIDVLVCASESEGTPNPVLEALASGVAVISTPVGVVPMLARENLTNLIVVDQTDDKEALTASIAYAIESLKARRTTLKTAGHLSRPAIERWWNWRERLTPIVSQIRRDIQPISPRVHKPRVCLLYDSKGWAFYNIALQLAKHLGNHYAISMGSYLEPKFTIGCDVIVNFMYLSAPHLLMQRLDDKTKIVSCLFDEILWLTDRKCDAGLKATLALSDAFLFANESMASRLRLFSGYTATCQDGVDTTLFPRQPFVRHGKLRVGWVGNAAPRGFGDLKGVELIREACDGLEGVELVIQDSSVNKVAHEQMQLVYRGMDVVVCMSSCEGTPNPVLEGASCGKPYISTSVGIVPEIHHQSNGRAGWIVPRDAAALRAQLEEVRDSPSEVRLRGQVAASVVRPYWDWSRRVEAYRDAIEHVLG